MGITQVLKNINIILIIHSILSYETTAKRIKKIQKIHQFKLLTLFSYQIILPVVFLNFFFVNNEKKLQSEKEPLGHL